jgi:hypothetical protein
LAAVDYPQTSFLASVCCKWLQGTVGGVGESSGIDHLSDVPGFDGCGTVHKAPPEFLEDRFCELRIETVRKASWVLVA